MGNLEVLFLQLTLIHLREVGFLNCFKKIYRKHKTCLLIFVTVTMKYLVTQYARSDCMTNIVTWYDFFYRIDLDFGCILRKFIMVYSL